MGGVIVNMRGGHIRAGALIGALLLYALFSTPTPDRIGWAEGLVMAGLLAAIGAGGLMQACPVRLTPPAPPWTGPARLLLVYGLSVPLVAGLAQGHPVSLIARDVIAFLFLLLPLLLPASLMDHAPLARLFPWVLSLMGAIFAVRVLAGVVAHLGTDVLSIGYVPDPENLVNAPTVLFAALFLTGIGGACLSGVKSPRAIVIAAVCLLLSFLLLLAMAGVGQRAHIGAWLLTVLCWMGMLLVRQPRRLLWPLLAGVAALICFWPFAQDIAAGLWQKNTVVGFNSRVEEARIVWESFRDRPWALLWGQGWGASFVSPAVGPDPVNYTHNLFTTYLLKGGLPALGLVLLYLAALGAGLWRLLWVYPVGALAVAAPFLIDITLYASFKSLDFGLLLVLIALWTRSDPPGALKLPARVRLVYEVINLNSK